MLLKRQFCIFLFLLPFIFYGQEADSLKNQAIENFKHFFFNLKNNTQDDSSHYEFLNFSDLEKKYAYPIDVVELSKMEDYANSQSFYDAHFIRKQNLMTQSTPLPKKVGLTYNKLVEMIFKGNQTHHHNNKKEQKLSRKLNRLMRKYPAPLSGYFQKAQIKIYYPNSEKKYLFLIEYSLKLDIINFGGINN